MRLQTAAGCLVVGVLLTIAHSLPEEVQKPLGFLPIEAPAEWATNGAANERRKLTGRFLHITDLHPDPFYKVHSATDGDHSCHRGDGRAGYYGAEVSDCDSPLSLINATFKWVQENLKDEIDFIVWTGDSARHDNDEEIPRNEEQVVGQNQMLVDKFHDIFGVGDDERESYPTGYRIPIIPTFGNNDILPHNIFEEGPNKWTRHFSQIWRPFIPEAQRHGFQRGGWFYVEVIPNKLAVFSLNTMYFFGKNAAVDGCADPDEPAYEHMEWLRIQLQFMRDRGMKAILSGHVPPARNDDKLMWDETCWQKFALWCKQYRDVIVGGLYGHMNLEHFVFQDFEEIDIDVVSGNKKPLKSRSKATHIESSKNEMNIRVKAPSYLNSLRELWSDLPSIPLDVDMSLDDAEVDTAKKHKSRHSRMDKFYDSIGGKYAERFALSLVSASIATNYMPALRVFEYNITGIEGSKLDVKVPSPPTSWLLKKSPKFVHPKGPSKSTPPGPAYSPQTFSLVGYTQYLANLTYLNNDNYEASLSLSGGNVNDTMQQIISTTRGGRKPRKFEFTPEYNTRDEKDAYRMSDSLVMRKWVELAAMIGDFEPFASFVQRQDDDDDDDSQVQNYKDVERSSRNKSGEELYPAYMEEDAENDTDAFDSKSKVNASKKHKHKKNKHKKKKKKLDKKRRKLAKKLWTAFVQRATVNTIGPNELRDDFGTKPDDEQDN